MIRPDYYSLDIFSNSELSRLLRIITGRLDLNEEDENSIGHDYYRVGNAYDALVLGGSEEVVLEDTTERLMVESMVRLTLKHPIIKAFKEHPKFKPQYEFFKRFYGLNFKCRLDGIIRGGDKILELKSTTATTQDAFENVIDMFDYDRQVFVYLTMSGANKCAIVGCQKNINPKIFVKWIEVGDIAWQRGKEKTEYLINYLRNIGVEFYE
jgi:hypothetical protein